MCVLCVEFAREHHWSDAAPAAGDPGEWRARARYRRVRLLSDVLRPYGLTVSDGGTGRHIVISDRKGSSEVAADLPAVWRAGQRLSPRRIDALDPVLLEALERAGGREQR